MAPKLETRIGELRLRNPTILAAGVLGLTGSSLARVWKAGAGGVIAKSVSRTASEGYPGPRIVEVENGLVNAMGLPNPGVEEMVKEIKIAKAADAIVIGSAFGKSATEFTEVARKLSKEADAVELNLSCPHAGGLASMGQDPRLSKKIIAMVKSKIRKPVWAKLPGTTDVANLVEVAKASEKAGADALTVSNTFPAMVFDSELGRPILGHGTGGLSGPVIKPLTMKLVYAARKEVKIPIVASGGVVTGEDAVEYLMAGASAVQIGTGIMYRDLDIFNEVCNGIENYLEANKYKNISNIIGTARSA